VDSDPGSNWHGPRLLDKVCIVTGSSRGVGAAIARGYASEGARVVVTYSTNSVAAAEIAREIGSEIVVWLDVRDRDSVRSAFHRISAEVGSIDVLVNNAGINRTNDFDLQTDEEWDEVLDVDLTGVFRCIQEVLPHLADHGSIINIGSLSGEYGGPRTVSYAVAKKGVQALTHLFARALGSRGIRVNTLSPGVIGGEFTEATMSAEVKETALRLMLIKRFATYEEMVGAAVYLASDESSYLTAQTISVNGGAWTH